MTKQKTLIFSLSAILFLALSFIAYSWNEPTTAMPSGYTAPLNTSFTAQTKTGEIGASMFRDADNSNYYINPSGDSIISGDITTSGNVTTARPTEADQVTTKGYVDEQIALLRDTIEGTQTLVNGAHTQDECRVAGGMVVDSDVAFKQCRFETETCPSGWIQYKNFSEALGVADVLYGVCDNYCCRNYDGDKSWGNSTYQCKDSWYMRAPIGSYDTPTCRTSNGGCFRTPRSAVGCY